MNNNKLTKWEWFQVIGTVVFFCLLSMGQLERWQVTPTLALYAHDLVLGFLMLTQAKWWLTQFKDLTSTFKLQHDWLIVLLLGWSGAGWILALFNGNSLLSALLYLARLLAYLGFNWQLLHSSWWPKVVPWIKDSERVLCLYWLLGLFTTYFGFLQYFLIPDIRFMGTFGWDVHLYRLVSVQLDPNITGALLILTLLLTLNLSFLKGILKHFFSVILIAAIALTYSRSTYGAVVVGLISWAGIKFHQRARVLQAGALITALVIMIVFLPRPGGEGVRLERTASGAARVETAQTALSGLSPVDWLVGNGLFVPGNFSNPSDVILGQHARLADNILILLLTGIGVGGLALLTVTLYRHRRALSQLSLLTTASTLAILAHSQFNNTLFQPFVWLTLTAIILTSFKYQGTKT